MELAQVALVPIGTGSFLIAVGEEARTCNKEVATRCISSRDGPLGGGEDEGRALSPALTSSGPSVSESLYTISGRHCSSGGKRQQQYGGLAAINERPSARGAH